METIHCKFWVYFPYINQITFLSEKMRNKKAPKWKLLENTKVFLF